MPPFDFIETGAPPRSASSAEERPTVVLLHSSGNSSRQWAALAERLQPRFHVHLVDFHGHGAQPAWRGPRPLTLADEVALIEPILRAAGRVHLIGHSYGGAVALKAAELHRHAVRSLVVYEPVLIGWLLDQVATETSEIAAVARDFRDRLARGDAHSAAARFLGYWAGPEVWAQLSAERQQAVAARIAAVAPHFHALSAALIPAWRLWQIRVPMLFLSGGDTVASMRRVAALLRHELPDTAHETLAGMGHMGPITHAAEVNRRIETFLRAAASADHVLEELTAA